MNRLLLSLLSIVAVAFACDCMMPTNQGAFCQADFVSHIKIVRSEPVKDDEFGLLHYTVQHVDTFKSPSSAKLSPDIYTSGSSASCGIDGLVVGKDYLVAGYLDKKQLRIHSCGQFQEGLNWTDIPAAFKKQLKTGFNCPATTKAPK